MAPESAPGLAVSPALSCLPRPPSRCPSRSLSLPEGLGTEVPSGVLGRRTEAAVVSLTHGSFPRGGERLQACSSASSGACQQERSHQVCKWLTPNNGVFEVEGPLAFRSAVGKQGPGGPSWRLPAAPHLVRVLSQQRQNPWEVRLGLDERAPFTKVHQAQGLTKLLISAP